MASAYTDKVLAEVVARNPAEPEFLQVVHEGKEEVTSSPREKAMGR